MIRCVSKAEEPAGSTSGFRLKAPRAKRLLGLGKRILPILRGDQSSCASCPFQVELTGKPAENRAEELIVRLAGKREAVSLHWLEEQMAEALYREELKRGGWVVDLGLWGSAPFHEEAARILSTLRPEFGIVTQEGRQILRLPEEGEGSGRKEDA